MIRENWNFSCPVKTAGGRRKPTRKKKDFSSFLARVQPWKTMGFSFLPPSQLPLPLYKNAILFWLCGDSQVAYHVCKSRIEIHCWSWINPSLLKKYLACSLLQVNEWQYGPFQCVYLPLFLLSFLLHHCSLCLQERKK